MIIYIYAFSRRFYPKQLTVHSVFARVYKKLKELFPTVTVHDTLSSI